MAGITLPGYVDPKTNFYGAGGALKDGGGYTYDDRQAMQSTADSNKMRQLQLENQTLQNEQLMQQMSAEPGSVRFQGPAPSGSGGTSSSSGSRSASGGAGTGSNPALDGLLAEIRNQQTPTITAPSYTPTKVSSGISPEANAATYGAAKEKIGLEMQAAMHGLRGSLAQRGIVGTGIDAEEQGKVYTQGLGQLGGVNRQIAADDAQRQLTADTTNAAASNQAGQFNASENLAAQQANAQAQQQRQNILLQLASLY
jgi:hypothetical protein